MAKKLTTTLEVKIKNSLIASGDGERRKSSGGERLEIHPRNGVVLYAGHQHLLTCDCPLSCKGNFLSPVHLRKEKKIIQEKIDFYDILLLLMQFSLDSYLSPSVGLEAEWCHHIFGVVPTDHKQPVSGTQEVKSREVCICSGEGGKQFSPGV